jgi:molecular chaperone DnaK (HSP70)
MILRKLKEMAEEYLGQAVGSAVITVPAMFNYSQRQVITNAATIAGLTVLYIISAPNAIGIAYVLAKSKGPEQNIVVFDLGGSTCNVSLLTIDDYVIEVKATAGYIDLGGVDFDNRVVEHFVHEFERESGKVIRSNPRAIRRLRTACERAKHALSFGLETAVELDALFESIDFYTSFTRARFEELCGDLFLGILEPLEKLLRDAKIDKDKIDEVIFGGGSTRIPAIYNLVSQFFHGKQPKDYLGSDEGAAHGAAIQAAILSGYDISEKFKEFLLLDAVSLSLGIETVGGVMAPLIKRNTIIPTKKSNIFTTSYDNQTSLCVRVYEGERSRTKDNNFLGILELFHIPPASRGVPKIEVTFDVCAGPWRDFKVSACEKTSGESSSIDSRDFDWLSEPFPNTNSLPRNLPAALPSFARSTATFNDSDGPSERPIGPDRNTAHSRTEHNLKPTMTPAEDDDHIHISHIVHEFRPFPTEDDASYISSTSKSASETVSSKTPRKRTENSVPTSQFDLHNTLKTPNVEAPQIAHAVKRDPGEADVSTSNSGTRSQTEIKESIQSRPVTIPVPQKAAAMSESVSGKGSIPLPTQGAASSDSNSTSTTGTVNTPPVIPNPTASTRPPAEYSGGIGLNVSKESMVDDNLSQFFLLQLAQTQGANINVHGGTFFNVAGNMTHITSPPPSDERGTWIKLCV